MLSTKNGEAGKLHPFLYIEFQHNQNIEEHAGTAHLGHLSAYPG